MDDDNVKHLVFLDTPVQCRAFLMSLDSPNGKPEGVYLPNGGFLAFTEMGDEEIVFYARQLGDMIDPKSKQRMKKRAPW